MNYALKRLDVLSKMRKLIDSEWQSSRSSGYKSHYIEKYLYFEDYLEDKLQKAKNNRTIALATIGTALGFEPGAYIVNKY